MILYPKTKKTISLVFFFQRAKVLLPESCTAYTFPVSQKNFSKSPLKKSPSSHPSGTFKRRFYFFQVPIAPFLLSLVYRARNFLHDHENGAIRLIFKMGRCLHNHPLTPSHGLAWPRRLSRYSMNPKRPATRLSCWEYFTLCVLPCPDTWPL